MSQRTRKAAVVFVMLLGGSVVVVFLADVAKEQWYLHRLCSPVIEERRSSAQALARIQSTQAVPYLLELMNDVGPGMPMLPDSNYAGRALRAIGKPALPALLNALKGYRIESCWENQPRQSLDDYRLTASQEIAQRGSDASAAIPGLIGMLQSDNADYVHIATLTLGNLCSYASENEQLGSLGTVLRGAVPHLITTLRNQATIVRRGGSYCLSCFGHIAEDAVPALVGALKDEDLYVRRNAAEALGNMPAARSQTVPELRSVLDDQDEQVQLAAAYSLFRLGDDPEAFLPTLVTLLQSESPVTRRTALIALGEMGERARPAIASIRPLTEDSLPMIRQEAERVLTKITEGND